MGAEMMGVILFFAVSAKIPDVNVIAKIESNHNPRAVSRAGALGLCQIMPQTWRAHAKRNERWHNPTHNRAVALRYLVWIQNALRKMGDPKWNDPTHILACYNGGIGQFKRCKFQISRMPTETKNYIRKYRSHTRTGKK